MNPEVLKIIVENNIDINSITEGIMSFMEYKKGKYPSVLLMSNKNYKYFIEEYHYKFGSMLPPFPGENPFEYITVNGITLRLVWSPQIPNDYIEMH